MVLTKIFWGFFFTVLYQSASNKPLKCSLEVWTTSFLKSWLQNPDLKRCASAKANKDELNTWMVEKKAQQNKL